MAVWRPQKPRTVIPHVDAEVELAEQVHYINRHGTSNKLN